jgi:hypothetical protein
MYRIRYSPPHTGAVYAAILHAKPANKKWQAILFMSTKPIPMLFIDSNAQPYLKSLTSCRNKMVQEGFAEDFTVAGKGLVAVPSGRFYTTDALEVINCMHFKARGKRNATAVLFVLQTSDGLKGTLVDTGEKEGGPVAQLLHQCGKQYY